MKVKGKKRQVVSFVSELFFRKKYLTDGRQTSRELISSTWVYSSRKWMQIHFQKAQRDGERKTAKKNKNKTEIPWLQKLLKELDSCHGNCQNLLHE